MKIRDVISQLKNREIPVISEEGDIQEVISTMVRFPHTRLIYVVDSNKKLCGTITVGSLLRHIFPYHYAGNIHGRGILRGITAEKAGHIMDGKNIYASPEDSVDEVLHKMATSGAKEIAIVDQDRHIVADITAIDLLKHYFLQ